MAGRRGTGGTAAEQDPAAPRNEVVLVGRLAAEPVHREMPSGDVLLSWRVVVDRGAPPGRAAEAGVRPATHDTLECSSWRADVRRRAASWRPGDLVEVEGALRRRFYRPAGAGPASRYEVEALRVRRVRRAVAAPQRRGRPSAGEVDVAPG